MKLPKPWKRVYIEFIVIYRRFAKWFRNRFKDVEVELYDVNKSLEPIFHYTNFLLVGLALASLIASQGFDLEGKYYEWNYYLEFFIVTGFILTYVSRIVLTSKRVELLKNRIVETVLFIMLSIFGISIAIGRHEFILSIENFFGIDEALPLLILCTQIYLIIIVVEKSIRAAPILISLRRHPAEVVTGSFFMVIFLGTLLLMTPKATVNGEGLSFIDAFFTSTSAVCVTGLIVVDTATYLTQFGQIIILILIQIGGLGILTIATLFALFVSSDLGIGQMSFLKGVLGQNQTHETFDTIKRIVGITFFIEAIGVLGYYLSWGDLFADNGTRLYYSIFHAVSAFCNAGFSVFTNSLADQGNALNMGVNITTMIMIVIGGLGFTTIWEILRGNPDRTFRNWQFSVHTRLVLVATAVLIVGGTAAFYFLETDGLLRGYETSEKILISMFQSITTRTAGFNTVDIGALNVSTTLVFLTLMIIGASPVSTAGGIKTTTISVLLLSVWSTISGKKRVEVSKRTISQQTIMTALTVFTMAASCLFIFTLILTITEDFPLIDIIFEEFSAFATVGLSRGITSELSAPGKVVIILSMFIGRVGIVTLALAFARRDRSKKYEYPTESVIVA